jgi:hypothetical protein
MKRFPIVSCVIAACLAAVIFTLVPHQAAGIGLEVPVAKAEAIIGGGQQCGNYQSIIGGACTAYQGDSCSGLGTVCDGTCPYVCSATLTFGGSGSFTGQLNSSSCSSVTQGSCALSICTVGGVPLPCCTCTGGSNVACGPAPYDLDTDACGG